MCWSKELGPLQRGKRSRGEVEAAALLGVETDSQSVMRPWRWEQQRPPNQTESPEALTQVSGI